MLSELELVDDVADAPLVSDELSPEDAAEEAALELLSPEESEAALAADECACQADTAETTASAVKVRRSGDFSRARCTRFASSSGTSARTSPSGAGVSLSMERRAAVAFSDLNGSRPASIS